MESKFTIYCSPRRLMRNAITLRTMMFSIMMLGAFGFAQAQSITGTVIDANGLPLIGVNVLLKNTSTGTVTDFDGKFQLQVGNQSNATITFSYIGYESKEVAVTGQSVINVTLNESASALDEVVVTALGIKKEAKKLGYAVETVQVDDMQNNRTTNPMASLVGKVAGLDISPPSSGAGGSNKIRLRGQSAFNGASNSPLIVINGLPMDQGSRGASGNNSRDLGDNLNNVNPDDIESMTVLKGATAAAIYGSRAANGAIIITTKSGAKNQGVGVEITSNYTAQNVLDFTDYQQEYGQGQGGNRPTTAGNATTTSQLGWGARLDGQPTIQFDGVMRPYSAYQPSRIKGFFNTGSSMTNTVALSGGGERGSFRTSFSSTEASGIQPTNEYKRQIVNLGLNQKITDKLSLQFNVNYTHEDMFNPPQVGVQGPGAANFLHRMATNIPLDAWRTSAMNPNGSERLTNGFGSTMVNPYYQIQAGQFFRSQRDRYLMTATLRYEFTDWLYAQGRFNYDYGSNLNEFNSPHGLGRTTLLNNASTAFAGTYEVSNGQGTDINADFLIGANKEFGDFSADVSIGGNIYRTKDRDFRQWVTDFVAQDLYSIENGVNKNQSYGIGRQQVNSLYAFADLGFKDILFLNATVRNDWFSVLDPKNNSYLYPSLGGSFIFSELMDSNWLSYGKLRATYGEVGSSNGIGAFSGNLTYSINQNQYNGLSLAQIGNGSAPNPLLRPFTVTEKEIGLELRMFKSRVNLDVAVFEKITTDQILNVNISNTSGYSGINQNLGSLSNRGAEFLLEVIPVSNDNFRWSSAINSAFIETKVLKLSPGNDRLVVADFGGNEFLGQLVYQVGQPLNQLSGRTYLRDAAGNILVGSNGRLRATDNYVNFGSALPKWTGGWTNTFTYKNVSLLVHMDYKLGGKVISSTALNGLRQGLTKASLVGRDGGVVFDAINEDTGLPNTTAVDPQTFYTDYRTLQLADPFIYKTDFVKLRNITLSYDLTSILRKQNSFIKGLTLSAAVRNVAVLYKDIPDLDPEAFASSGDSRVGYEQTTLPTTRDFSVNVNIKF